MKILTFVFCCLLVFQSTKAFAQDVPYEIPPPIDLPTLPISNSPTIPSYTPERNYSQYINGDIGGDFYGGYGNNNSNSCGVKVGVNPFKAQGDFLDMFSVSWSSKKCTDEEKIQKIKQTVELERVTIQQQTEVTTQAIKYCLEARQTAVTHNQDPDVICPLSFITELKH